VTKSVRLFCLMLVLVSVALIARPAHAAQDMVQFGSNIEVPKDTAIHDAVCFFCSINVQGTVNGNMVVFFGSAHIEGQARHDVVVFFGDVKAEDNTSIGNNIVNFFGSVHLGENVDVKRDTVVMFGSLEAARSASFGGNRVVEPGIVFWGPFLAIAFGIYFIVHEVRGARRRRILRGY
jgi:hypothetical protein